MDARFTILTHFSQRYSKVPQFDEFRHEENVGVAYDNLSVTPRTFAHLRAGYSELEAIFEEDLTLIREREANQESKRKNDPFPMAEGVLEDSLDGSGLGGGKKKRKAIDTKTEQAKMAKVSDA